MKRFGANPFVCRVVAAAAFLSAPLVVIDASTAEVGTCTPAAPVDNAIVTCTGGTITANDPNGYGTGVETGNTINVDSTATVTGTSNGITVHDATINNSGAITGAGFGLFVDSVTVANGLNGTISGTSGIKAATSINVTGNDGTIAGTGASGIAIDATSGAATVTNGTGTITGTLNGIAGTTVELTANNGTIEATAGGGIAIKATDAFVTNGSGTIRANGDGGSAILANRGTATVANGTGTIQANGVGAIAINAFGGTVTLA